MDPLDPSFRIAELDVAHHAPEDRIVGLFRFENTGNTKSGPTLLILAEIHSTLYIYERLLDVINATAESARYLVAGVDQDPVGRFEKLVERLNEAVAHFVASEGTPMSWGRVNICVAELSKGHICFTGMGALTNLFLQKQEDGSFRGFDILGSLEQPAQPDPQKPFAALVCGDMKPGDILFIGSGNLERLRGELRLKERLSALPPVTAALEIKQDLEDRGIPDHFLAGIITCHEAKPVAEPVARLAPEIVKSTSSIQELRASEAEANEHLSPVISPVRTKTPEEFVQALRDRLEGLAQNIKSRLAGNKTSGERRSPDAMRLMSLRGMNAGYGSVLTKQRKTMLIGGAVAILVIFGGVWWWKYTQRKAAENTAWVATFEQATDNRNKAESDLIYGNEGRARGEIAAAEQGITALPADTEERTDKINTLKKEINDLKERLKKITPVNGVQELTVLPPGTTDGSLLSPILSKNGRAYVLDASSHSVISINTNTKEVKRIALPDEATPFAATEGTSAMTVLTKNGLYSIAKSDDSVRALTANQLKTSSTKDITLYTSRLYSLEPEQNQIWRAQNTDSGFGAQTAYIKAANTSLSDAVSMAIDSNVYVLKGNGTLVRFLSGGQEGFALAPIDPPLTNATGLFTDIDTTSIYIADPTGKRVLVFDKTGSLKSQITAPEFNAPSDVSVDEANKRMIVTDGNRLLLVPLP